MTAFFHDSENSIAMDADLPIQKGCPLIGRAVQTRFKAVLFEDVSPRLAAEVFDPEFPRFVNDPLSFEYVGFEFSTNN